MRYIICFILYIVSFDLQSQNKNQFANNFSTISKAFEEVAKPYFIKLVSAQFPPDVEQSRSQQMLEMTRVQIYEQKSRQLSSELKAMLIKTRGKDIEQVDRDDIYLILERVYLTEFAGLDYTFYENVRRLTLESSVEK